MQSITESSRMYSLVILFDMHTTYFTNVLNGISDNDTHNRLNTKANHIAWLTGSMTEQRYEVANVLGLKKEQAAHNLFKDGKSIQDDVTYPTLAEYKKSWEIITTDLRNALLNVTDDKLNEAFEMMPGFKLTIFELITFIIYREANIIGQIALWRRLLGYEGMKYQ